MSESIQNKLNYALLLGQGRSGTNYLLNLFNQSPLTHCRNEADQIGAGALRRLNPYRFFVDNDAEVERLWDDAFWEAALAIGPRDHLVQNKKFWIYPGMRNLGYFYLRNRYMLVHRLTKIKPKDGAELPLPRWVTSPARLEKALHVFKLNSACGLAGWMFRNRPTSRAIQIVRHPGGFTKSWLRRWVEAEEYADERDMPTGQLKDKDRLRVLAQRMPKWAELMGDIDSMTIVESELWWWRYVNETIFEQGRDLPNYKLVIFEELAHNPVDVARDVYTFCGLPWDTHIERRVQQMSRSSKKIAAAWKDELDKETVEIIERIFHDSFMSDWWAKSLAA